MREDDQATEEQIIEARRCYCLSSDDNIEVDEEAAVSIADDGVWVAAWVWLPNEGNT